MTTASYVTYFGMTFILCLGLTPLIRKLAFHRGWVAQPCSNRWHRKPTALLGGVAIYVSIVIPLLTMGAYSVFNHAGVPIESTLSFGIVLLFVTGLLFILGLIDDFKDIAPYLKLIGQVAAASVVVGAGYRLNWFSSGLLDCLITLLWIVGITNAVNFIDNMDGLCAGICVIAAVYFTILFFPAAPNAAFIALIIAGASAGFLVYNFDPAKIFMGDCGSMVLGFSISFLSLYYSANIAGSKVSSIAVPILILAIPIFDAALVTLARTVNGRSIFIGGKDHTSHRLVLMGLSDKKAVLVLYGVAVLSGIGAVLLNRFLL